LIVVGLNRTRHRVSFGQKGVLLQVHLHALAKVAFVSHDDKSANLTKRLLTILYSTKVCRIASLSGVRLARRLCPQHFKNLIACG
jgi:hypothetical protein